MQDVTEEQLVYSFLKNISESESESELRVQTLVNKAALKWFVFWHTPLDSTQAVHVSIKVCHSVLIKPTC